MFIHCCKTWTDDEKDKLCRKSSWEIDGDNEWYREDLYCSPIDDEWTYETLVTAIDKDVKEGLSVEEILEKYIVKEE